MKSKPLVGVLLLAAALALALFFQPENAPPPADPISVQAPPPTETAPAPPPPAPPPTPRATVIAAPPEAPTPIPTPQPAGAIITPHPVMDYSRNLNSRDNTIHDDLDIVASMLEITARSFKGHAQIGNNEDFVDLIVGENHNGLQLLDADHPAINQNGELVDRWGTPFFIHPMDARTIEIHSAGPDRQLFTDDDIAME